MSGKVDNLTPSKNSQPHKGLKYLLMSTLQGHIPGKTQRVLFDFSNTGIYFTLGKHFPSTESFGLVVTRSV
jgi:hypothetical protein